MKKIILTLFLFILTLFVLDRAFFLAVDYFYNRSLIGQDGGDINKYLHDNNTPSLVIMGSSTTRFQVNPDSFPVHSCNLGHHSTTIHFQLALLQLMIQEGHVPKNILLNLAPRDYLLPDNDTLPNKDIFFLRYYYPKSDYVKNEINNYSLAEKFKFIFASYRFNGMLASVFRYYFLTRQQKNNQYYFTYQKSTTADSMNVSNGLKAFTPPAIGTNLSKQQTDCLLSFIDLCKKNKINLLCYYMPMLWDDSTSLEKGLGFMDSVTTSNKIPYYRFTKQNYPQLFNNLSYWADLEHLNEKGGEIESGALNKFTTPLLK